MSLDSVESWIHCLGGLLAYATLAVVLYGIWRGTRRRAGLVTGQMGGYLRSPWFYLITSAVYFGFCFWAWIPLPLTFVPGTRIGMLAIGALLYFPGLSFALWGRLSLGANYFVSTGLGAQLFADHRLVTNGPFAVVRHPMYAGIFLAALGSLLIYHTWTTVLFAGFAPLLVFRARREEAALAVEFGEQWRAYCRSVPPFFPRFGKKSTS